MDTRRMSNDRKEALRRQAEKRLAEGDKPAESLSALEMSKLVQELRVHQVELELQNEELRKTQVEIERSRESYRNLWELSPVGYLIVETAGRVTAVNRAGREIFGRPENAILGKRFSTLVAPEDRVAVHFLLERAAEAETVEKREIKLIKPDGAVRICQVQCKALGGEPGGQEIQAVLADITERKGVEEALRKSREALEVRVQERTAELDEKNRELQTLNKELEVEISRRKEYERTLKDQGEKILHEYNRRAFLAKKLMTLLERDRHEIGTALHEEIAQILVGVTLELEGLKRGGSKDGVVQEEPVEHAQDMLVEALTQARNMSYSLRSDVLDRFGLIPAIKSLIKEVETRSNFTIRLFTKSVPDLLKDGKGLAVYRIVQESLINIVNHAGAKEVFVTLIRRDDKILVTIEDDGVGFEYDKFTESEDENSGRFGILIMRERAEQASGQLHIESRPGKGTRIIAEIPVEAEE